MKESGLKTLARNVGCKDRASIARQVMKDETMKSKILEIITKNVQKEMKHLTSRKSGTNLRSTDLTVFTHFSWESVVKDLQTHAPTLHKLMKGMVQVKRKCTKETDKQHSKANASRHLSTDAVMGVCASILLRHRNQHINLFQKVDNVSIILNSGHASAQYGISNHKLTLYCFIILIVLFHRHSRGYREWVYACHAGVLFCC